MAGGNITCSLAIEARLDHSLLRHPNPLQIPSQPTVNLRKIFQSGGLDR